VNPHQNPAMHELLRQYHRLSGKAPLRWRSGEAQCPDRTRPRGDHEVLSAHMEWALA
jgi:hypothetical protein